MAKVLELPEQRVILWDISWETYERLLAENGDRPAPRLAYDRGALEVMSPSTKHEMLDHIIGLLVEVAAAELDIDVVGAGHTTFRREDLQSGFEPDGCFYVQDVQRIRGKETIDLTVDPPPDLIVEIDITSRSLNKLPIYARIGVPEVWRHDGQRVIIYALEGEDYVEVATSRVLPPLTADVLSRFVEESWTQRRPTWMRNIREWARRHAGKADDPAV